LEGGYWREAIGGRLVLQPHSLNIYIGRRRVVPLWRLLLPHNFLAGGGAVERALVPCARFGGGGAADAAFAGRLEDSLNFDLLGLVVVFHVLYELVDGVLGAVDLVVFGGEGLEEEGGEGGGAEVLGGVVEDLLDLSARIELGYSAI